MSLLITLTTDETFNKSIIEYKNDLKKDINKSKDITWFKNKDHLVSLKFIAHIEPEQTEELISLLQDSLPGTGFVTLNVEEVNYFPNDKGKSLVAFLETSKTFKALYTKILKAAGIVGFDEDSKNFRPHITLARYKNIEDKYKEIPELKLKEKGKSKSIDLFNVEHEKGNRKLSLIARIDLVN
jgi:2'-5' RNA ligase